MSPEYESLHQQQLDLQDEIASLVKANTIVRHQIVKSKSNVPQLIAALDKIGERIEIAEAELDITIEAMALVSSLPNKTLSVKNTLKL